MKNDTGLLKEQLPQVTNDVINVLNKLETKNEIIEIALDYSQRLRVCAQQSILLDDFESTRVILENLRELTNCTITLKNDDASRQIFDAIQSLETTSLNKRSWNDLFCIVEILEDQGKSAIENNCIITIVGICICLKQLVCDSINFYEPEDDFGPFNNLANRGIDVLSDFSRLSIINKQKDIWNTPLMYLADVSKCCRKKKNAPLSLEIAKKILDLWIVSVTDRIEIPAFSNYAYEAYHAHNLAVEYYKYPLYAFDEKIMEIGIFSHMNGLKYSEDSAARLLADFRLLNVPDYNTRLNKYFENLKTDEEKQAYRHIFEMSVVYAVQKGG